MLLQLRHFFFNRTLKQHKQICIILSFICCWFCLFANVSFLVSPQTLHCTYLCPHTTTHFNLKQILTHTLCSRYTALFSKMLHLTLGLMLINAICLNEWLNVVAIVFVFLNVNFLVIIWWFFSLLSFHLYVELSSLAQRWKNVSYEYNVNMD